METSNKKEEEEEGEGEGKVIIIGYDRTKASENALRSSLEITNHSSPSQFKLKAVTLLVAKHIHCPGGYVTLEPSDEDLRQASLIKNHSLRLLRSLSSAQHPAHMEAQV